MVRLYDRDAHHVADLLEIVAAYFDGAPSHDTGPALTALGNWEPKQWNSGIERYDAKTSFVKAAMVRLIAGAVREQLDVEPVAEGTKVRP